MGKELLQLVFWKLVSASLGWQMVTQALPCIRYTCGLLRFPAGPLLPKIPLAQLVHF